MLNPLLHFLKMKAVMIPLDIVIAVPTLSVTKVDIPDELISDVIKLGSLLPLIVPVVILAALERLVAVVAVLRLHYIKRYGSNYTTDKNVSCRHSNTSSRCRIFSYL